MHQGWPKFAAHLWMATPDGGLAAVAYAPERGRARRARRSGRQRRGETDYPFRDKVRLAVEPAVTGALPLDLRIPAWAAEPRSR